MKETIKLLFGLSFLLLSCSSDDSSSNQSQQPKYAMTAKINGVTFEANNPYGTNLYSSTNIWSYFPEDEYVILQGRKGGVFGDPEIDIWLKKSDIAVGTHIIGSDTFSTPPSHFIDLINNSNNESENTREGIITITEVNPTTKIVRGTFSFTCAENHNDPSAPINHTVTEGTFNYQYID